MKGQNQRRRAGQAGEQAEKIEQGEVAKLAINDS